MSGAVADKGDEQVQLVAAGFVDVVEAAKFLGVSRAKLYATMDSGELVYAKFGRSRRIPRTALLAYAAACMVGA